MFFNLQFENCILVIEVPQNQFVHIMEMEMDKVMVDRGFLRFRPLQCLQAKIHARIRDFAKQDTVLSSTSERASASWNAGQ